MRRCGYCDALVTLQGVDAWDADTAREAFVILVCPACGCGGLANPPSDAQLARYYEPSYYGRGTHKFLPVVQQLFDAGKRTLARSVIAALEGRAAPRVLDVGCGTGQLLVELERLGAHATGLERRGGAARAVQHGLRILEADLGDHAITPGTLDAVVIWHVLEHLRDPAAAIRIASDLLAPGGVLFLAVPNAASWQARVFGRYWFHLDVPRHLHFLTLEGLAHMLGASGLAVARTGTLQFSQSLFGFVQSFFNAALPPCPNRLYRLMRSPLGVAGLAELAVWSAAACLVTPVAIVEALCSALAGVGAIRIVVARKP